ncbi:MAG: tetratricopeptide repeat protein, partial [Candidatus Omnitrophota bacterium]|nr:tetratricopeptide repeat protein [Candidatus Omnitrophota bacterium]
MGKRTADLILIFIVLILGATVYLNSLLGTFIWDDVPLIVTNLHIRDLGYIPRLFLENIYHQDMMGRFYRPVLMAAFALDYKSWGLDPFGYHFTNVLIHLSNAVLVFNIILLLFGRRPLAFLTAVFFILHPVQTEAVTYISGRADPLAAFFCLVSFMFFIEHFPSGDGVSKRLYYAASILFFVFGLLTKEVTAFLPFIFILYEACSGKFRAKALYKYIPLAAVLCVYAFIRHIALLNVKNVSIVSDFTPLFSRLLTIPSVIVTYFKLLLFPAGLHMERSDFLLDPVVSFLDPRFIISSVFLITFGIVIWLIRNRSKPVFFGFLWFILSLLPVLNIRPINAFVAEHWLYFPSIGFFMAASAIFLGALNLKPLRPYIISFLIIICAFLGALTIRQNYVWRDPVIFYKYTLRFSPQSARVHTNLGVAYSNLKLYKEAEKEYLEAIRLDPFSRHTFYHYLNLGALYDAMEKEDKALSTYEKAIAINPNLPLAYRFMGNICYRRGKYQEAIKFYKKAAEITPTNAYFWNDLGNAYLKAKMYKEAAAAFERAIKIYPYFAEANYNLGNLYAAYGDFNTARRFWKKALEINPAYVAAKEK